MVKNIKKRLNQINFVQDSKISKETAKLMDRNFVRSICRQILSLRLIILIALVTTSTCYVRSSVTAYVSRYAKTTLHLHRSSLVK
uniref:Uncharacterized protein n=1 Tax=Brassica campestris TaxID=3711 RepID=A0A3P5ZHR3_BRACM|nr:unnamed protein product [Brassica rapa]